MRLLCAALAMLLVGCAAPAALPPPTPTAPVMPAPSATDNPIAVPSSAPPAPSPSASSPPPSPSPTPRPIRTPTASPSAPASPAPVREAFSINLYREGAFVSEYTKYYCLPAAMQTMINIMGPGRPDTTRATQDRLYRRAAELDGYDLPERVRDVEPEGWANALNAEGYGPYAAVAEPTLDDAVRLAARQLRSTGKPVGLLTWRGAHSWVMSGFEATADPLHFDDFEVTGVWIQDVWWPRVSNIWGESDPPNTLVPVERLPQDYLRYRRPYGRFPDKDGQYVLVIPLVESG